EAVGDHGEAAVELAARDAARIMLTGDEPPLQVAGEPVGAIGRLVIDGDAFTGRIFMPAAGVDVAGQKVAAFLPPYRPFRRAEIAAIARGELLDRLRLVDDRVERGIEPFNPLALRPRALRAANQRNAAGGKLQHMAARDSSVSVHVDPPSLLW